jgi:hypothetical protein
MFKTGRKLVQLCHIKGIPSPVFHVISERHLIQCTRNITSRTCLIVPSFAAPDSLLRATASTRKHPADGIPDVLILVDLFGIGQSAVSMIILSLSSRVETLVRGSVPAWQLGVLTALIHHFFFQYPSQAGIVNTLWSFAGANIIILASNLSTKQSLTLVGVIEKSAVFNCTYAALSMIVAN